MDVEGQLHSAIFYKRCEHLGVGALGVRGWGARLLELPPTHMEGGCVETHECVLSHKSIASDSANHKNIYTYIFTFGKTGHISRVID